MSFFSFKDGFIKIKIVSNTITDISLTLRNSNDFKDSFYSENQKTRFWYNLMARTLLQLRSKIEQ